MRIEMRSVNKTIKHTNLLSNINLVMESGHIYGFIGDNGSGKTVLFKVLLGLMQHSSGQILIDEKERGDLLQDVGFIIERPNYIPYYTAKKNLKILASYTKKVNESRIEEVLTMFGLPPNDTKKVGKYSLGMKQKLALAMAFLENPQILILDEPLSALDIESVENARVQILREKENGKIILVASHYAEDIHSLCDVVYKMEHGVCKKI